MTDRRTLLTGAAAAAAALGFGAWRRTASAAPGASAEFTLPDAEWRKRLSPEAYQVLRHEATEAPGSSPLDHNFKRGTYDCAGCALPLFASSTKFDSGTGWPSFYQPLANAVRTRKDGSLMMQRIEVHCRRCAGHLGHVFDDGPKPTGLRYCMNGVALEFVAA